KGPWVVRIYPSSRSHRKRTRTVSFVDSRKREPAAIAVHPRIAHGRFHAHAPNSRSERPGRNYSFVLEEILCSLTLPRALRPLSNLLTDRRSRHCLDAKSTTCTR